MQQFLTAVAAAFLCESSSRTYFSPSTLSVTPCFGLGQLGLSFVAILQMGIVPTYLTGLV